MNVHEKINYIEYPCRNLEATQKFFSEVFAWSFESFGPDYIAFSNQGVDGGFFRSEKCSLSESGSALTVFYSENLENTQEKVLTAGGEIIRPTFSFPGGRRFHFLEPSGNEFSVWSDK